MNRSIIMPVLAAFSLVASPVVAAVPQGMDSSATAISAVETSASYDRHDHYGSRHHDSYGDRDRHHGDYRHDNRRYYNNDHYRYRQRCHRDNGTAGLLIGGAAGAAIGNEVAGDGDRTTGALLGAAGGALIGKNLDDGYDCR